MNMTHTTLGKLLDVRRGMSIASEDCATEGTYKRLTCGNFDYNNHCFTGDNGKENVFFVGKIREDCLLKKGAIITPLTEQAKGLLGETARIPDDNVYVQSGDIGLVIPYEDKLDDLFAYYLVSSPVVKKQLGAGAQQTKIRHTSPDAIKACEVWVPEDIKVQHQIGEILDKINNKIALNNSICADLESLAKEIYDYWFVQFDFPNEEGKPYKSSGGKMVWNEKLKREIPEGWGVETIGNLLGAYPKTVSILSDDYSDNGKYPIVDQSRKFICGYTDDATKVLRMGSAIVFGDHTNFAKYINFDFARGADGTQIINSNNEALPNYLLYLQICELPVIEQGYSRHYKFLKEQFVIIPNIKISKKYMEMIQSSLEEHTRCIQENRGLESLRDFLLPMLMNGQIKVGKDGE